MLVSGSEGQRKSKAIGFGGRFESMFHKADNVPETSFTCSSQQYPGLYADPEVECRVCSEFNRHYLYILRGSHNFTNGVYYI